VASEAFERDGASQLLGNRATGDSAMAMAGIAMLQSVCYSSSPVSTSSRLSSNFFRGARISSSSWLVARTQQRTGPWRSANVVAALPDALLFDCDGVLVDTERDGHRVSFNKAFEEKGAAN